MDRWQLGLDGAGMPPSVVPYAELHETQDRHLFTPKVVPYRELDETKDRWLFTPTEKGKEATK